MSEVIFIIGVLAWATAVTAVLLMKDGYYGIIRFKNRHIKKRIDILYCMGMVESANILQAPLINHWRSKL